MALENTIVCFWLQPATSDDCKSRVGTDEILDAVAWV